MEVAFVSRCCLTTSRVLAPIKWTGSIRASPDLQSSSSEEQNNVLSFGDFSLHGQEKLPASPRGAEALASESYRSVDRGAETQGSSMQITPSDWRQTPNSPNSRMPRHISAAHCGSQCSKRVPRHRRSTVGDRCR